MRRLHKQEGMLFALLRASLHQKKTETCFFEGASADDWKACYKLACQQGVMALAWDGVLKLPAEMIPPKALKITWGMAVHAYEKKYERYCNTIQELSAPLRIAVPARMAALPKAFWIRSLKTTILQSVKMFPSVRIPAWLVYSWRSVRMFISWAVI